jgi:copper(I)-binding protein
MSLSHFKFFCARRIPFVLAVGAMLCACAPQEEIQITTVWLRAAPPSRDTTAAYMQIENTTFLDNALIAAETSAADIVELHAATGKDEVMRMRPVKEIALPKQDTVNMEPGGYHLMLFGLQRPLQEGDQIYFTLFFKNQTTKIVKAEILKKPPPLSRLPGAVFETDG